MKQKKTSDKNSTVTRSNRKSKQKDIVSAPTDRMQHKSRETDIQDLWDKRKVYKFNEKTAELPTYVMREMPTPVHRLSTDTLRRKIYQDIFLKSETMQGHSVAYTPLWETFPFNIEASVIKENNTKTTGNIINFRKQCRQLYSERLKSQQQKFKNLGIFADWSSAEKTLEARHETKLFSFFDRLRDTKYLQDELRLSHWCPNCVTPLEQGKTVTPVSTNILYTYVKFPFNTGFEEFGREISFAVRFPISHLWEIAGIIGIGIYENTPFCLTEYDDQYLIFAEPQLNQFVKPNSKDKTVPKLLAKLNAKQLNNCTLSHPLFSLTDLLFFTIPENTVDNVSDSAEKRELMDGIIPLNPAHHTLSHNIFNELPHIRNTINSKFLSSTSTTPIFDETGRFTEDADTLCGLYLNNAIQFITDELESRECLINARKRKIEYLECQHCNGISVLRPFRHWTFSTSSVGVSDEITTSPEYWEHYDEEIRNDIKIEMMGVSDMQISSQRQWGIPLPVLRCDNCNHLITDKKILRTVRSAIRRGSEHWFRLSVEELLPTDAICTNCNSKDFRKESTYIESYFANLLQTLDISDFKKSTHETTTNVAFVPRTPFIKWLGELSVLAVSLQLSRPSKESHPFKHLKLNEIDEVVRDTEIHDSILEKYPADIIRLFSITPDIHQDLQENAEAEQLETLIEKHCQSYESIKKTYYQAAEILTGFKKTEKEKRQAILHGSHVTEYDKFRNQDFLALLITRQLLTHLQEEYEKNDFYKIWVLLFEFCQSELDFYIGVCKTEKSDSVYIALTTIYIVLLQRIAPILPYLAEELYREVFSTTSSIFEEKWYHIPQIIDEINIDDEWESLKQSNRSKN